MAFKLSKADETRRTQLCKELEDKVSAIEKLIADKEALTPYDGDPSVTRYGFAVAEIQLLIDDEINDFVSGVVDSFQSEFDDKSERWQESDRGQEVSDLIQEWDDLDRGPFYPSDDPEDFDAQPYRDLVEALESLNSSV